MSELPFCLHEDAKLEPGKMFVLLPVCFIYLFFPAHTVPRPQALIRHRHHKPAYNISK